MPTLASSRYCGIARITPGTSTPARITLNTAALPGKAYLARAKPAIAEMKVEASAPTPAYAAVLAIQRQNRPFRYALRLPMLSSRWLLGARVNVENSSDALLLE